MESYRIKFIGEFIVLAKDIEEAYAEAYERFTSNPFRYLEVEE